MPLIAGQLGESLCNLQCPDLLDINTVSSDNGEGFWVGAGTCKCIRYCKLLAAQDDTCRPTRARKGGKDAQEIHW